MYFSKISRLEKSFPRSRSAVAAMESFFSSNMKFCTQKLLIDAGFTQSKHHSRYKSSYEKSCPLRSVRHWFLAIALTLLSRGDSYPWVAAGSTK